MSYETRHQTYDETLKILEKKDYRGIAEFILPAVKEADEITLEQTSLSIPDLREADFLTRVSIGPESFILHIEFETAYKSNTEMQKRMLRYYTYIKWHSDLPIYQVLVVLKEPANVKTIAGGFKSIVQGLEVMHYQYEVMKVYEIDKYQVLKEKKVVLYPLRVFMKHPGETEEEHILECLTAVEELEDKDYYFLTLECIKKLYEKSKYQKFVKEEILMQSSLYREPYEKGLAEGVKEGVVKGRQEEKAATLIKFLMKRFGSLPVEMKQQIKKLDVDTLDVILDRVLEYKDLEEVKKYIQ